jgi:hypothetical protein
MINRRIFLGSTIGAATSIKGVLDSERVVRPEYLEHNDKFKNPGILVSYQWNLAEISFTKLKDHYNNHIRYLNFPLEDSLDITFEYTDNVFMKETWLVLNWQTKGLPFDIIDFINIEYDIYNSPHRIYRNMRFGLASVQCYHQVPLF